MNWRCCYLRRVLLEKGRLGEAESHARNALRIAPSNPQAHNLMGIIMTEARRPQVGEYHYRRFLELSKSRDPILLANLAWNLKNQGRMAEARALYEESVAGAPEIRQTLLGLARLEEADRNFEAAGQILDKMDALWPNDPNALLSRAVLLGRMKQHDKALQTLDRIALQSRDGRLGPDELLEKGRLLDQMGHYEEAFAAFDEGKRLGRELSGNVYRGQEAEVLINRLRNFFVARRLKTIPRATVRSDVARPIFILGFPRSGTTLVEQTLSAHPQISAGDELPLINDITAIMPRMLNSPLGYLWRPVATTLGDAMAILRDAVAEMDARYQLLARGGFVNLGERLKAGKTDLPFLLLIFDEFADLILAGREDKKEFESLVARIAGKGRAAGIHLVLATQRPDRLVVTGLIKANLPLKVCLKVANAVNAQIVLDEPGAERLFGKGDLLCDFGKGLVRAQGLFIPQLEFLAALRLP
jgi:Flp pilus assembly protein TadD